MHFDLVSFLNKCYAENLSSEILSYIFNNAQFPYRFIVPYSFWIFIFIQSFLLPREVTQGNLKTKQALPAHISVDDHSLLSWHISRSNLCLVAGMYCSNATERKIEMNIGIYFHSNNVFEKFSYYRFTDNTFYFI